MYGRHLAFNADDCGRDRETNKAILSAYQNGLVTSTSIMMCAPATQEACGMVKQYNIPVGIHIVLSCEDWNFPLRPLTKWLLLRHPGNRSVFARYPGRIFPADPEIVFREASAQVFAAKKAGLHLRHFDAHMYGLPMPDGRFSSVVSRIARKYHLPFVDFRKGPIEAGVPIVKGWRGIGGRSPEGKRARFGTLLKRTRKGLHYVRVHVHTNPVKEPGRYAEWMLLRSKEARDWVQGDGITLWPPKR